MVDVVGKKIEVLPPYGFLKLVDWSGDELSVVNAARVSFHQESDEMTEKDSGLVRYLLMNQHGTPFEQAFLSHWHIKCPIFVAREWMRHRIGYSYNEASGRYSEYSSEFYFPSGPAVRTQVGKPGAYTFEPFTYDTTGRELIDTIFYDHAQYCFEKYQKLLKMGVAKEVARNVLPLNTYTEFRWTANARSLMNFLALRNSPDALFELREYAKRIESVFKCYMPVTHNAFIKANRVAP